MWSERLWCFSNEYYGTGIVSHASIMKEILWTNNVNFIKDVHMIYAYFIIIAIILSGKKRGNYFHTTPHIIVTHHLCFLYRYQFRYANKLLIYTLYILITALYTSLVWMSLSVLCSQKHITVHWTSTCVVVTLLPRRSLLFTRILKNYWP